MANCETGCTIRAEHLATCEGECWGCLPVHTDWKVCHFCYERFGKNLIRIGQSWNDLQKRVTKPGSYALRERVTGTPEIGLVVNEHIMDLMAEVRDWLLFVCRIVMTENSGALPSSDTLEIIKLLQRHIGFLTMHELAPELVQDARRFASKVERAAYPTGEKRIRIRQEVCTRVVNGAPCGGQLSFKSNNQRNVLEVECKSNPTHTLINWLRVDEVAVALGKNVNAVYALADYHHWAKKKRGKLTYYSQASVKEYLEGSK